MPLVIALSAVVQVCLIYHVYRTGRPLWWAFLILSVPIVGSLLYYALAMIPASASAPAAAESEAVVARRVLDKRLAALALCPSVSNKIAAAEEYVRLDQHGRAVELYESALSGPHAADPTLLLGLARAQVNAGTYERGERTLRRLAEIDARYRRDEAALLRARIHEGLGRSEEALAEYEEIALIWVGLEAKFRYALLLERLGFFMQAGVAFRELLEHARRYRVNPGSERRWIELAQGHIQALDLRVAH